MARNFDGTADHIITSAGAVVGMTYGSIAVIVRRNTTGVWNAMVTLETGAGAALCSLEFNDGNNLVLFLSGSTDRPGTTSFTSTTTWYFIAADKATGTATVRFHIYNYTTNAWTHENANGTQANFSGTIGQCRLGRWQTVDDFNGDLAVAAVWENQTFTDAQWEASGLPFSLAHWHAMVPTALWGLDQSATGQSVGDLTGGGANQTSLSGTSVATTSVPILSYGGEVALIIRPQGGATLIVVTDSGSVSEVISITVVVGVADAGTAAETLAIAAVLDITDAGAATDDVLVTVPITLDDSGAVSEAVTVTAAVAIAEAGAASDVPDIAAIVVLTDAGAAAEVVVVTVPITVPDSGAGAEVLTMTAAVPIDEAGAVAEALTITAVVAVTDAGTASEVVVVTIDTTQIVVTDAGTASEALTVAAQVPVAEDGTAGEAFTATVTLALADAGTATETIQATAAVAVADAGTGAEALTVSAAVPVAEAGAAAEALAIAAVLAVAFGATAGEVVIVDIAGAIVPSLKGPATLTLTVTGTKLTRPVTKMVLEVGP